MSQLMDGEFLKLRKPGATWRVSWHSAGQQLEGNDQGAEGLCELVTGEIVLVREVTGRIAMPGGHPFPPETAEQTLFREVYEEASARVLSARLIGYCRSECVEGKDAGLVLVRDMYHAVVELGTWNPLLAEITERLIVARDEVVPL